MFEAIEFAKKKTPNAKIIAMTPSENIWNQKKAQEKAATYEDLIILCGRYEGFDSRIFEIVDEKISVGKFILTGGEIPAMIVIDSIVRLIPGVLGGEKSAEIESYSDGDNLEFPQFTRPANFRGMEVPEVLLSGHHAKIDEWRKKYSK